MSKLPTVSASECIQVLEKTGFYIHRQKGSHITMRRSDPRKSVTVPNHKELAKGMLRKIIADAELTVDQFIELLKD